MLALASETAFAGPVHTVSRRLPTVCSRKAVGLLQAEQSWACALVRHPMSSTEEGSGYSHPFLGAA